MPTKALTLLLTLLATLPAIARNFDYTYEGQTITYTVIDEDAKTVKVTQHSDISGNLILPAHPKSGITEYTLTEIDEWAFYFSHQMTSVTIPESVTSIGAGAFAKCESLTSIEVESANPQYSSSDGVLFNKDASVLLAFPGGKTETYIIPNSVTSIGKDAFYDCRNLTAVIIPESVTSIGGGAFYDCRNLTSVTIPESATSIENSTFTNCCSLTTITIPEAVTSIGNWAFCGCSSLASIVIPNSVTEIGRDAFGDCTSLASVTIGNSVRTIGEWAFYNCIGLTSVLSPTRLPKSAAGHLILAQD